MPLEAVRIGLGHYFLENRKTVKGSVAVKGDRRKMTMGCAGLKERGGGRRSLWGSTGKVKRKTLLSFSLMRLAKGKKRKTGRHPR